MKLDLKKATKASYTKMLKEEGNAAEMQSIHVRQTKEVVDFDTYEKVAKSELQKYNVREWPEVQRYLIGLGYTVDVLFDPRESGASIESDSAIVSDNEKK